ncbi:hypothetical protein V6R86_10735 [Sphingomonas kaistensis]|uniref:site-specific DNA-methyltransferase (adenine-specific) n=1 Tax=Sphingomonas kaistensis TaxID=298708 RepID=A0ABZ2G503_9SPHN
MTDAVLFTGGSLFSQDYLVEGIKRSAAYGEVDAIALRERLQALLAGFPHATRPNEATTESDLVWPVLEALGWSSWLTQQNLSSSGRESVPDGLLFINEAAKSRANEHAEEWKRYAFGSAIIESKRWGRALDRAEGRSGADRETPSTQLLRYLRRIDDLTGGDLRWGILTNGGRWRLYYAGARSTIDDYLEIDLARIIGIGPDVFDAAVTDEEREHWLRVFAAMFSRSAFERQAADAPSFHDQARREAAFYEERVAKNLSDLVFARLYPSLGRAIAEKAPADTELEEIRNATLILLYRLLFILYAEDRGLLPVRDARYDDYALRDARKDVGSRMDASGTFSTVATPIWDRFSSLAMMIDKGDPSVGLPPYNGGLFSASETPLLKVIRLPDSVMAEALDILSWEQREGRRRYINYRDLSVQQLGSIYERLLEFEMKRVDGRFEIQPNIFARKDSGSYYTPDELVLLIIDETLAPLIKDAYAGFANAVNLLRNDDSEAMKLRALEAADPARSITRLRVCDPAMGSGHFLVSLVDRLTNAALEAMAKAVEIASEAGVTEYQSPIAIEIEKIRSTIWHNAQEKNWSVAEEQLDDPQLVKRMVLKRCIHGVDKNPMAVELAKVALWLHTFTVGAPLSFINHHLHCGDSLFGLWVRDAIDKAGKAGELLYIEELRNAERQASQMQRIEALTDAEVAEVHASADMWKDIEFQTGPFDSFVSFVHAIDWLDLPREERPLVTQWLDGGFGDPLPIARGKKEPEAVRSRQEEAERFHVIWREARKLIEEERFFNWQIAFPGVWKSWTKKERDGGFDAVIGNPPWDRMKLQKVEWFAARRPAIAQKSKAADRERIVKALERSGDPLFNDYQIANERALTALRVARKGGHYPLLGKGDINLYSLFVERAHSIARPGGMIGLLTPIGIGMDKTNAPYISAIAESKQLKAFISFENRRQWLFKDVHAEDQPTVLIASNNGRSFDSFRYAVKLHALPEPDDTFELSAPMLLALNPNTGTIPVLRSKRDAKLTAEVYKRVDVFVRKSGQGERSDWACDYATMFHMTNDSDAFATLEELKEQHGAWSTGGSRFESAEGAWLPLYEGKSVQLFNHRYASIETPKGSVSGQGQAIRSSLEELQDINFVTTPRYWVRENDIAGLKNGYAIGFNDICNTNNARSVVACMIPRVGTGNKIPLLDGLGASDAALLLANLASIPLDYIARNKIQSRNLNKYILEQLPIISPASYARAFGPKSALEIVREIVLELTFTAYDIADFARDLGHVDAAGEVLPPFIWDEERRLRLRAKLDALYFILYGIYDPENSATSRDEIRYIYSTFPAVERQEIAKWNSYRSRDLALAWISALMAGRPDANVE